MLTMWSDKHPPSPDVRECDRASKLEALVSRLSRTGGYIALALGIIGTVALLRLIL